MFTEVTRYEVIHAGGTFLKIDWSEFDRSSVSHHRYSISTEALPLKDKWFKYFMKLIKGDGRRSEEWLTTYKNFYIMAKINANGKYEERFDKQIAFIEKELLNMKEVRP